jgi:phage terminase small subunit
MPFVSRKKGLVGVDTDTDIKHQRFVEEYIKDLNGRQSAIRAGYSEKGAIAQASLLLTYPHIKRAIRKAIEERSKRTQITSDKVLKEVAILAFSNIDHYNIDDDKETGRVTITVKDGIPRKVLRAVSGVKIKKTTRVDNDGREVTETDVSIKLWDKPSMLKLAGKHVDVKGFSDKLELSGKDGGPIVTASVFTDEQVDQIETSILGIKKGEE